MKKDLQLGTPNRSAGPHFSSDGFRIAQISYIGILLFNAVYRLVLFFIQSSTIKENHYLVSGEHYAKDMALGHITACRSLEAIQIAGWTKLSDLKILTLIGLCLIALGIVSAMLENVLIGFFWKSLQVTMWSYGMARSAPSPVAWYAIIGHYLGVVSLAMGVQYSVQLLSKKKAIEANQKV